MWFFWILFRGNLIAIVWATVHLLENPAGDNLALLIGLVVFSAVVYSGNYMERQALNNGGRLYADLREPGSSSKHR
ncbi:TPA: hypothetical protein N3Z77_004701 [Salmonella enterica subsp. enterica serovar 14:z:e,n,x]|nr:hypothetical protein [Salmonella enterica subsp. enterica serovar 14:z:e,n,x]